MIKSNTKYKRQLKTPISYYGGKQRMLRHIIPIIPSHEIYVEPFFGGGAVFFAKTESSVEIINDQNDSVVNFYRVLKHQYKALCKEVDGTLHSRSTQKLANSILFNPKQKNKIKKAWAFWVMCTMSYASNPKKNQSFGYDKFGQTTKKVKNSKAHLMTAFGDRLNNTQIESTDALRVIKSRDSASTFFYLDPPYPNTNQGSYAGYSIEDFEQLLKVLKTIKGKFLLSSFPEPILTDYIKKNRWCADAVTKRLLVTKRKEPKFKEECLTANYDFKTVKSFNQNQLNGISSKQNNLIELEKKGEELFKLLQNLSF